jgi:hypothetical protein
MALICADAIRRNTGKLRVKLAAFWPGKAPPKLQLHKSRQQYAARVVDIFPGLSRTSEKANTRLPISTCADLADAPPASSELEFNNRQQARLSLWTDRLTRVQHSQSR